MNRQPPETIYVSHEKKACSERALVLEAAGIRFEIRRDAGEHTLLVAGADVDRARAELDAYTSENRAQPPRVAVVPHRAGGGFGVYCFVAILLLVDILQDRGVFGVDWALAGRTNADLIRQGQWWRTLTALCLHADAAHLAGNVIVGGLFGFFASQLLGSGLAWSSILLAGAAGNGLNALIRRSEHTSVGASTAVFAALGIISAYAWTRRRGMNASWSRRWGPIVGGVVLLGYLGTGGARTDVVAHVAGFGCGLMLGLLYGKLGHRVALSPAAQLMLGAAALAALVCTWALALTT